MFAIEKIESYKIKNCNINFEFIVEESEYEIDFLERIKENPKSIFKEWSSLLNNKKQHIEVGDFVQNCDYIPCVVISNTNSSRILVKSLLDGSLSYCSERHYLDIINKDDISTYLALMPYHRLIVLQQNEIKNKLFDKNDVKKAKNIIKQAENIFKEMKDNCHE